MFKSYFKSYLVKAISDAVWIIFKTFGAIPLLRRAAKVEEVDVAKEEVREKRRGTSVSLTVGSG